MTTPFLPAFLQPNVSGLLSNKRGSNTGADSIAFQAKYSNPAGIGNQPGSLRAYVSRLRAGAVQPDIPWDSWWSSSGNIQNILAGIQPSPEIVQPNCTAIYNGRIYYYGGWVQFGGNCHFSAPINGSSIGTWRAENGIPNPNAGGFTTIAAPVTSIVIINGYMYAYTNWQPSITGIWFSQILGDGSLGAWTQLTFGVGSPAGIGANDTYVTGYSDLTGNYLIFFSGSGSSYNVLNPDGTSSAWVSQGANQPGANGANLPVYAGGIFVQPSGKNDGIATMFLLGGSTFGAPTVPTSNVSKCTLTKGAMGAWSPSGSTLPAARSNFGFTVFGPDSGGDYIVIIVGGNSTTAYLYDKSPIPSSGQVSTVWFINASSLSGGAFSVAGALATAVDGCGAAFVGNKSGTAWTVADVYCINGNAAGTVQRMVQHSHWTGSKPVFTNASTGNNLVAADLGTGASVVVNNDGTVSITFLYGGLGSSSVFSDGDAVTLFLQITDNQGDPSGIASLTFQVGQPPTISGVSPGGTLTVTTPSFTFNFTVGAGGGPEDSWRLEIIQGPATNILYDTGITKGQGNSQQVVAVPALPNGTYALYIIGYSTDIPYPGSSNQNLFASSIVLNAAAAGQPT